MKPIIFSTTEVKEILNGNKVQFRKPVKNLKIEEYKAILKSGAKYTRYTLTNRNRDGIEDEDFCFDGLITNIERNKDILAYAPYRTGDILYVKESWADHWLPDGFCKDRYVYKTDGVPQCGYYGNDEQCKIGVWSSPVIMPKEAARIFLKVTDVRVQKLQKITDSEVIAEGVNKFIQFVSLWNKTYGRQGHGWDKEPWVWVFGFERVEKE